MAKYAVKIGEIQLQSDEPITMYQMEAAKQAVQNAQDDNLISRVLYGNDALLRIKLLPT